MTQIAISDDESMMVTAGQAYLEAANWIITHPESPGQSYMLLPFHTLLGLSLEMLLKTVLLRQGMPARDFATRRFGHDLVALRDEARNRGFRSQENGIDEIIAHIAPNYGSHDYRYVKPNSTLNKVNAVPALNAMNNLLIEVGAMVGLPVVHKIVRVG
ncbi:hypothetical protein ACG873_07680 [Mesorhizobium sp. AaZ16]|uniref:hypothetical protein n=1 Tax=Mesorhizobium sp. AaZ16 TaxID=3402289 RepID=UPI00374F5307